MARLGPNELDQSMSHVAAAVSVISAILKTRASLATNTMPLNFESRLVISLPFDNSSRALIAAELTSESTNHSPASKSSTTVLREIRNSPFDFQVPGMKIAATSSCRIARIIVRSRWEYSCTTTQTLTLAGSFAAYFKLPDSKEMMPLLGYGVGKAIVPARYRRRVCL